MPELEHITTKNKLKPSSFVNTIKEENQYPLYSKYIEIFQMNVGKLCNMTCTHCHVEAGPNRTENMTIETFEACLKLLKTDSVQTIDLTGGSPEMNDNLLWFLPEVSKLNKRIIIRSNLTILLVPKYSKYLDLFAQCNVEVVASLPCYLESNTNEQRGKNVFKKSIKALQELNKRGYGQKDSGLVLNLVHNPVGTHLPPNQVKLETDYKSILKKEYNIDFNTLFCITNMPIKRFTEYLLSIEKYDEYMQTLLNAYNPVALENIMCKNTISISYDGKLYDCDFNQMLDLPLKKKYPQNINNFDFDILNTREIVVQNHCYGCTAGSGSSCQGSLDV